MGNSEPNQIYKSDMYKCAICGKLYSTVEGRARCEINCIRDSKESARVDERTEYYRKRNESEAAIDTKMEELNEMVKTHISNYKLLVIDKPYYFLRYVLKKPFYWWF